MSHPAPDGPVRALRPHVLPALLFVALAVFILGPAFAELGAAVPGHPQSDAYEHLQGYWWVADRLADGELPWRAAVFGVPDGGVLWFPDLLGAVLVLPVTWAFGAPVAVGLAELGMLWAAMLGGYALGVQRGGGRAAGVLAGVIFGASPYALGLLHSGVTEYLHLAAFPVLWLCLERSFARGGRATAGAALAWAWLGWANAYYAMFAAAVPLLVWWSLDARPPLRVAAARLGAIVGLAALLVLPVALTIRASMAAPDAMIRQESAPGWDWVYLPANDLAGFVLPGDQLFPDFTKRGNFGIRHVHYLGLVALGFAVAGLRRWWRPLLFAGVLALGPTLHWRGQPVQVAGQVVPLPAALLYVPGSPFRAVHHPYRLVVLPMLVLAAAAADAVRRRPAVALAGAAAVFAEVILVSPGGWPVPSAPLGEALVLPEPGGVWELPPDFRALNRKWLGRQAVHQRPVPYTVNVFLPASWRQNAAYQAVMGCLRNPERRTIARDARPPLAIWLEGGSPQTLAQGVDELRGWGLRYVVLTDELVADERTCLTAAFAAEARELPAASGSPVRILDLGSKVDEESGSGADTFH